MSISRWSYVLTLLLLVGSVAAQALPKAQLSNTTEGLRGVSVVSQKIAWASGTKGMYLRTTDGGEHWAAASVPDAETLDFRGVAAFSADEAFLMSSGTGGQSRVYHTSDAGQHWSLQFTDSNPKGFFDSIAFWDSTHGIVIGDPVPGDPVPNENGKLKFEVLLTQDGQTWKPIAPEKLPAAVEGEGAFAASNTCIAILRAANGKASGSANESQPRDPFTRSKKSTPAIRSRITSEASTASDPNIWFATGGSVARVFHSADRGERWEVFQTPIVHGADSTGIFSIAFRDAKHGVIAGGDYKRPDQDGPNLAFTGDGGKTWTLSSIHPQAFFSAVAYDSGTDYPDAIFAVNPRFIFDLRSPGNPTRISPGKKADLGFNAVATYAEGGALFVGPKGAVIRIPARR